MDLNTIPLEKRRCAISGELIIPGDRFIIIQVGQLRHLPSKPIFMQEDGVLLVKYEELFSLTNEAIVELLSEI